MISFSNLFILKEDDDGGGIAGNIGGFLGSAASSALGFGSDLGSSVSQGLTGKAIGDGITQGIVKAPVDMMTSTLKAKASANAGVAAQEQKNKLAEEHAIAMKKINATPTNQLPNTSQVLKNNPNQQQPNPNAPQR